MFIKGLSDTLRVAKFRIKGKSLVINGPPIFFQDKARNERPRFRLVSIKNGNPRFWV